MKLRVATQDQQKEIEEILAGLRLGKSEREVYLALLQHGETTTTPLSRTVGLPVTTTQSILKRLVDLGVVKVGSRKSRHVYEAKDPIVFRKLAEEQLDEVKNLIPLLHQLRGQSKSKKNQIYTYQSMSDVFREVLSCKSKVMYEIMSPKDFQEMLGEKFHLTKRRVDKGIFLKCLRVETFEIKKYSKQSHKEKLREVKFLPREFTFRSSIVFWDDSVAFFSSESEGLACVITSASIREMMQQLFDVLWSVSRTMETA